MVDFGGSVRRISYTSQQTGIFDDGFETGDMSRWTNAIAMTVQSQQTYSGAYAARATTTGSAAWAYRTLGTPLERVRAVFHYVRSGRTIEPTDLPDRGALEKLLAEV